MKDIIDRLDRIIDILTTAKEEREKSPHTPLKEKEEAPRTKNARARGKLTCDGFAVPQIDERYTARLTSRLKELCIPLHLKGADKRRWTNGPKQLPQFINSESPSLDMAWMPFPVVRETAKRGDLERGTGGEAGRSQVG